MQNLLNREPLGSPQGALRESNLFQEAFKRRMGGLGARRLSEQVGCGDAPDEAGKMGARKCTNIKTQKWS